MASKKKRGQSAFFFGEGDNHLSRGTVTARPNSDGEGKGSME